MVSHPIQHFCPLYREVAADGRVDVKVFFASDAGRRPYFDPAFGRDVTWGGNITDGFNHEFLPGYESYDISADARSSHLGTRLDSYHPEVVQVYGYRRTISRQALYWTRRKRQRSAMVSDSELLAPRSLPTRLLKAVYLPLILRLPTGFITIGDQNESYYRRYGVKGDKLWRSPIPIDSTLFDGALADGEARRGSLRQDWGLSDGEVAFLTVGKTIPRKRHPHVLEAIAAMPAVERRRTVAVFAGGGPGTADLEALSHTLGVRSILAGFLTIEELASAYLAADVLVHPSARDPHPLAIAEAVYMGLPIVLCDRIGSWGPTDDVRPESNGLRYRFGDITELSRLLATLVRNDSVRAQLGVESRRIGQTRSISASASSYLEAILGVLARR